VAAHDDLAELAARQQLDGLVDLGLGHLDLDAPDLLADRSRARLEADLVERRHRGGLGQAVALEHLRPEHLGELLQHRHRQCRTAGQGGLQRGAVLGGLGRLQQADVHRRHAHEVVHFSFVRSSSACAPSKRGSSTTLAPT
jgi:hypothetical protein